MTLRVVLLLCFNGLQKTATEDCSAGCATIFGECVEDAPYIDCLNNINSTDQEFIAAGCVSGCTPTSAMTALENAGGGGSEGEEDEEGEATNACTSGIAGTAGTPLTSACYSLNSRTFKTQVPSGSGPFPVLILVHGAGEAGDDQIRYIGSMAAIAIAFILIAPDGIAGEWTVDGPADVTFVSSELLNHIAGFSNVQPSFTVMGYSKGAFLTNKILVENDDQRIIAGITQCTQLSSSHFNNGSFYMGENVKASLTTRRLLQVTGANDDIIPPGGGAGGADDAEGFLEWKESVYRYAQAYGYSGQQVNLMTDAVLGESVTYLNGDVQGHNFANEGHMVFTNDAQQAVLFSFLNVQSPLPCASTVVGSKNKKRNKWCRKHCETKKKSKCSAKCPDKCTAQCNCNTRCLDGTAWYINVEDDNGWFQQHGCYWVSQDPDARCKMKGQQREGGKKIKAFKQCPTACPERSKCYTRRLTSQALV